MTDDALAEIAALRERLARLEALATAPPTGDPPLTYESVKKMSRTEINQRWPEVQAALAAGPSPSPDAAPAGEDGPWPWRPPNTPTDPALTAAAIRKMPPEEINRRLPEVAEVLKEGSTR